MISKSLFGNRLKEKRKFLGLTQAQAAEKAGIERETWGKYERVVFMPSGDVLLFFEYGNRCEQSVCCRTGN